MNIYRLILRPNCTQKLSIFTSRNLQLRLGNWTARNGIPTKNVLNFIHCLCCDDDEEDADLNRVSGRVSESDAA